MSKTGFLPLSRSSSGVPNSAFLFIRILLKMQYTDSAPPQNSETPALLSPSPGMRLAMWVLSPVILTSWAGSRSSGQSIWQLRSQESWIKLKLNLADWRSSNPTAPSLLLKEITENFHFWGRFRGFSVACRVVGLLLKQRADSFHVTVNAVGW